MTARTMLNIGCGSTHHRDWINLDISPADPGVLAADISAGLPFPAAYAEVCYSSHVLEHLDRGAAAGLVAECFRVLKPGGVIRLVLPDLESLAREYLRALGAAAAGGGKSAVEYDWIMLELYDQAVRTHPGGDMARFLSAVNAENRAFVRGRIGTEADAFWAENEMRPARRPIHSRINGRFVRRLIGETREKLAGALVHLVAGNAAFRSFRIGLFRTRGEVHQWMYDRYSIGRLLQHAGFAEIEVCAAAQSRIAHFGDYALDVVDGNARKPDSIYVEASKP